jgi:hypothetical protein
MGTGHDLRRLVLFSLMVSAMGFEPMITAPLSTSPKGESGLGLVSPNAITVSFGGNGSLNLQGAIYLPNQASQVSLAGTVNLPCAQVIAGTISLSGNDQFGNDGTCGVSNITTPGSAKLVQ